MAHNPPLPITLVQGQKAEATTQYVESLQVNFSGIVMPILGAQGYMLEQPGLTQYAEGEGVDRGGQWNDQFQTLFRVSGNSLISVLSNGTVTVLGTNTVSLVSPQASLTYSFINQSIVVDGNWYLYNPTDGARQITDPEVGNPIDHVWIDGLFCFTDGERIYHTDPDDEEAISPLTYATSEFSPDRSKGCGVTTDDKWMVFNRFTIEFFQDTANEFFAFTRIPSRTIQYGIINTFCKAQIGGDWFIMGGPAEGNISLYVLQVGTAKNISCRAVDQIIAQYSERDMTNSILETRIIDDYPYLLVHLPNECLMFNLKLAELAGVERAWSLLSSGIGSGHPYRAIHGVFDPRRAQWTYGDRLGPTIGYLDNSVSTHYEALVDGIFTTPLMYLETASIDQLMIQTVPGFTAVADATVFFSITFDGGVTWSSEYSMDYGDPSAYNQRFIAFMLGYVTNTFAFKFRKACTSRMAFATGSVLYG